MKPKKLFYILLAAWVLLDMLAAIFTPVHADEAYYALYGQFLDWGYYDHPPMVALLTFFSSLLCKGNLSIRFCTVFLHGLTVWLIWETLSSEKYDIQSVKRFFAIAFSMIMFSVYGVVTAPDAPLLFFTALFFFLYKKYLVKSAWTTALFMGLTLSGMLYSKYMAVLVVVFVMISNWRVLKDPKIWMAGVLAIILFLPHILWQLHHDFPSLAYHLIARNTSFSIRYPLEYLPNQLLVFNPVCLVLALYFCFKNRKSQDLFEKSCIYSVVGFVFFFWIMTFKGHAEPHWTVAASIPMIVLLFNQLKGSYWQLWMRWGVIPVAVLLLLGRLVLPIVISDKAGLFISQSKTMEAIHQYCGDTPVVFPSSFQESSLYRFYTQKDAVSLSSLYGRQTQFDLLQLDKALQGKPATVVSPILEQLNVQNTQNVYVGDGIQLFCKKYDHFQGANRLRIEVDKYHISGDTLTLDLLVENPYDVPFYFNHPEFVNTLHVAYKFDQYFTITCSIPDNIVIPSGGYVRFSTQTDYFPNVPFVICVDNQICRSVNSRPMVISKL